VLSPEHVPDGEREQAATASGPLGAHEVSAHSVDVPIDDVRALATSIFRPRRPAPFLRY